VVRGLTVTRCRHTSMCSINVGAILKPKQDPKHARGKTWENVGKRGKLPCFLPSFLPSFIPPLAPLDYIFCIPTYI
jgi:hypothetical protein